ANLVSNARHHGELGETIEVRAFAHEEGPMLQVSNVAPEIPAEVSEALFKPFKPTSVNNPRNQGGMGLGLYIAHQIVMEHGGDLRYRFDAPRVVFTMMLRAPT
ncbi:MAG: ATP-binding protein, partial [Comamonadaceae bacterium]